MLREWDETATDEVEDDAWEGPIREWLTRTGKSSVTSSEILRDALEIVNFGLGHQKRVGSCMARLGWSRKQFRVGHTREWRYVPATTDQRSE